MSIENRRQLDNTRAKLAELEELYEKKSRETADDEHLRELTLRSLKSGSINSRRRFPDSRRASAQPRKACEHKAARVSITIE